MSWAKRGLQVQLEGSPTQESRRHGMIKLVIRLVTLTMFLMALIAAPPVIPAFAAGGGDPPSSTPPPSDTKSTTSHKGKKKTSKQSGLDDPAFIQGYRAAYATIYDRNDYASA